MSERTIFVGAEPELACATYGPREGAAVVLLHSLGTDQRIWEGLATALSSRFRVLVPDSRGHGASGWTGSATIKDWVNDLGRVLAAADVQKATLLGLSMGGVQAIAYAQRHPESVRALILADTFAQLDPELSTSKAEDLIRFGTEHGMASLAARYAHETFVDSSNVSATEAVASAIGAMDLTAYAASARSCFGARLNAGLGRIEAPTLVIWGDRDQKTPRALAEHLRNRISGARLAVIEGAGHLSCLEQPAKFRAVVSDFLSEVHTLAEAKR